MGSILCVCVAPPCFPIRSSPFSNAHKFIAPRRFRFVTCFSYSFNGSPSGGGGNLECCGSKVMGVSCDGAASNRNFFRMHGSEVSGDGVLYKTTNFYSKEKRWLYFCSDVPHLIKTTRNCWSHSHEKGKTRSMAVSSHPSLYSFMQYLKCSIQINNKRITWNHLVTLYKRSQATREPAGLYLLKTLKLEHVQLNSYSRMRVDLAAQVRIRVIGKPFLWIISMIPFCRL